MISGANGTGKTNILEALSLFGPGRGMRAASISDIPRVQATNAKFRWGVATLCGYDDIPAKIAVTAHPTSGNKLFTIEGEKATKSGDIPEHIRILWHTPSRRHKIAESASERRKWLDNLISARYPLHDKALHSYDHYMRERMRVLQQSGTDQRWLDTLEQKASGHGAAITRARYDIIDWLKRASSATEHHDFPKTSLRIDRATETDPAIFAARLASARDEDAATGRAGYGAHRSDIILYYDKKDMPLHLCSAGEQKALIFSVLLDYVIMSRETDGHIPILLLDEAFSELDPFRQQALCACLDHAGAQYWLTGPDPALFKPYERHVFHIRLT